MNSDQHSHIQVERLQAGTTTLVAVTGGQAHRHWSKLTASRKRRSRGGMTRGHQAVHDMSTGNARSITKTRKKSTRRTKSPTKRTGTRTDTRSASGTRQVDLSLRSDRGWRRLCMPRPTWASRGQAKPAKHLCCGCQCCAVQHCVEAAPGDCSPLSCRHHMMFLGHWSNLTRICECGQDVCNIERGSHWVEIIGCSSGTAFMDTRSPRSCRACFW